MSEKYSQINELNERRDTTAKIAMNPALYGEWAII